MPRPTLIIIGGPAGTGKTTLAYGLARRVGCPAICRDEIKEGMVHTAGRFDPAPGDELTRRTFPLFFDVLTLLVSSGVTVIADAAFQDQVWRPKLEPLMALAELRIVQCYADRDVAWKRIADRASERNAHADGQLLAALEAGERYFEEFDRVSMPVPSIDVDTTSGYSPSLDEIVAFVNAQ